MSVLAASVLGSDLAGDHLGIPGLGAHDSKADEEAGNHQDHDRNEDLFLHAWLPLLACRFIFRIPAIGKEKPSADAAQGQTQPEERLGIQYETGTYGVPPNGKLCRAKPDFDAAWPGRERAEARRCVSFGNEKSPEAMITGGAVESSIVKWAGDGRRAFVRRFRQGSVVVGAVDAESHQAA